MFEGVHGRENEAENRWAARGGICGACGRVGVWRGVEGGAAATSAGWAADGDTIGAGMDAGSTAVLAAETFEFCTAEDVEGGEDELTRSRVRSLLRLGRGGGAVGEVVEEASAVASDVEILGRS